MAVMSHSHTCFRRLTMRCNGLISDLCISHRTAIRNSLCKVRSHERWRKSYLKKLIRIQKKVIYIPKFVNLTYVHSGIVNHHVYSDVAAKSEKKHKKNKQPLFVRQIQRNQATELICYRPPPVPPRLFRLARCACHRCGAVSQIPPRRMEIAQSPGTPNSWVLGRCVRKSLMYIDT